MPREDSQAVVPATPGHSETPVPAQNRTGDARAIVSAHALSFAYLRDGEARQVLRDVDFALHPGECVGLCGHNGSGKTTFFRCLTGLERPQAGEIRLYGAPVRSEREFYALRRAVGFVLQDADDQLFSPTVLEDVAFGPLNLGLNAAEARVRAETTLDALGLHGYGERLTHRLSGGEKKLVSLATVLAMRPAALLLDEPTTGLDPDARQRIIDILRGLDSARVVISHDWDFLAQVSSTYYSLDRGRLLPAAPCQVHVHRHAHPLGDMPHAHES